MSCFTGLDDDFKQIGKSFSLAPFAEVLQPIIEEVLVEQGLDKSRKGTLLVPTVLIWLVLSLTIRRDMNYHKVLNWMVSGFRWLAGLLPPTSKIVSDGAVSHARVRMGIEVFRLIFIKLVASFEEIEPDFQGRVSAAFDGSTGTMPDSEANCKEFSKPNSGRGQAAFPQLRLVALLAVSARLILDVAYGAYTGKGTGERALMRQILARQCNQALLFLLDAGLYSIEMIWTIIDGTQEFLVKVPKTVKLKRIKTLPDGSYLALLTGKIIDPDNPKRKNGDNRWKKVEMTVRVIDCVIPGFRPFRLMTNILDADITARELALHYHNRWDIEIAYDEIKTHQCATLRGQSPTTFRSKRPDLVGQELYAMLIMYNLVRLLIIQATAASGKDPRSISFLDTLQHIIDAAPLITAIDIKKRHERFNYLLALIADCDIDRPRRHRINPRVVKVKMSKFRRKNKKDKSESQNLEKELKILDKSAEISLIVQPENSHATDDLTALIVIVMLTMMSPYDAVKVQI